MIVGRLRIPNGRRLFGSNIVPTDADVAPAAGQQAWSNLFLNWDARWPVWIKPQVDYLCGNGIGANCIRMIGGLDGVAAGLYSQNYHDDKLEQLVSYVNSLGAHFFLCGSGVQNQLITAIGNGLTATQYAAMQATTINRMSRYDAVIGCDLIQEAQGGSIGNVFLIQMTQEVRSRLTRPIPLTCSASCVTAAGDTWLLGIGQHFDFLSVHLYFRAVDSSWFDQFLTAFPQNDILIGEFGRHLSDGVALQVSDYERYFAMGDAPSPRVRGALQWAASDQQTLNTERWGVYSDAFQPRQWMLDVMRRYTFGSVARNNAARR